LTTTQSMELLCCPMPDLRKSAAFSLSECGGTSNRTIAITTFSAVEIRSSRSLFRFPVVFIKTNLTVFSGALALMASHSNRTASVTSFLGFPKTPVRVRLCPRHEATHRQPFTWLAISSGLISVMLALIMETLSLFFHALGIAEDERTMTL